MPRTDTRQHITKRLLDGLPLPPEGSKLQVRDDELIGFGVVVHPTGRKVFVVEYGDAANRRRFTLGAYGPLTVDAARKLAAERLGEVAKGGDPLKERANRRAMPTFTKWKDDYLARVKARKKRPEHDMAHLRRAAERWGSRPLDSIRRGDVEAAMQAEALRVQAGSLRRNATNGSSTANRWLASVRACFAEALRDGIVAVNPAVGITPRREAPPRDRVLTDAELRRVATALDAFDDPHVRAAFVVLVETGARKSEVLRARWADFDLDAGTWRLPSPKSGRPQMVPLAPGTVAHLRALEHVGEWLVPGRDTAKHREDLRTVWTSIRATAKLEGVTIHDIRRTFGLAVARSAGLHVASKLLRHSDIRITERVYAPLGLDDLRAATTTVQKARSAVVPFRKAAGAEGAEPK